MQIRKSTKSVWKPVAYNRFANNDWGQERYYCRFDRIIPADVCQVVCRVELCIGYELRRCFCMSPLQFMETRHSHLTTGNARAKYTCYDRNLLLKFHLDNIYPNHAQDVQIEVM